MMDMSTIIDDSEDEYVEPATDAGFHSISGDAVVHPKPAQQFALRGGNTMMALPVEPGPPVTPPITKGRSALFTPQAIFFQQCSNVSFF